MPHLPNLLPYMSQMGGSPPNLIKLRFRAHWSEGSEVWVVFRRGFFPRHHLLYPGFYSSEKNPGIPSWELTKTPTTVVTFESMIFLFPRWDMFSRSLEGKLTGWCLTPTLLIICSSFSRENDHPLLICSSPSAPAS